MGICCSSLAFPSSSSAQPLAAVDVWPVPETVHSPQQTSAHKIAPPSTKTLSPPSGGLTLPWAPSKDVRRDKMADTSSPYKLDLPVIPLIPQPPPSIRSQQRRPGRGGPSSRTRSISMDTPLQQGTPTPSLCPISRSASASVLDNMQRAKPSVKRGPFGIPRNLLQFTSRTDQQIKTKGSDDPSNRPCLKSTLQDIICDDSRFRILVLGERDSGKSSLINAVFKVDMSKAPVNASQDIVTNAGFCPRDNHRLVVHECSGLEPRDMQPIRDFITTRSQPNLPPSERLHAVWICVSMLDAINGMFVEKMEILGLGVPVVVVFTKFDLVVSKDLFNIASGDSRSQESARATAYRMSEAPYHTYSPRNPGGLPSEIVSTDPKFGHLIESVIATTNRVITTHSSHAPASPKAPKVQLSMSPVQLAWSVSQRANRDVIIQATIEVGRSRYWRDLWASDDFAGHTLANCVEVIHGDIVDIWNFPDKDRYLSSIAFRAEISHLVQDLSGRPISALSRSTPKGTSGGAATLPATWLKDQYQNSKENICCVMGYIVDLSVVLSTLFESTVDVSPGRVQSIIRDLVDSGRKTSIHGEICSFIRVTPPFTYQGHDVIMERIIDLIRQFCVQPPSKGHMR